MNNLSGLPWPLTFSYGRALQDTALAAWSGNSANFGAAQKELLRRAKLNGLATTGAYAPALENQAA
jgi:fructose-bisphosphate aldolase class I